MQTKQRQYSPLGNLVKKFLHTKIGAFIGYNLGISGFNRIDAVITRANGKKEFGHTYNSRVNRGAALTASLMSGSSLGSISSPLPPLYIALSPSTLTPAYGDTTLSGETSSSGMGRALGTAGSYTSPGTTVDGAASYTITNTFTATGSITIVSAALFDASSSGNMFVEGNLSASSVLISGDSLSVTWTVNV